jgi:hypothetical protein
MLLDDNKEPSFGWNQKTNFYNIDNPKAFYLIGYLLIWQPSNQQGALTPNLPTVLPL